MRIDRLTIRNFRCFEERTFDFHPQFNMLIGENASGKTSILEALAIAAGSWLLGLNGSESRHIRPDDVRLVGKVDREEIAFNEQYPVTVEAIGKVQDQTIAWCRKLTGPNGRTTSVEARDIKRLAEQADRKVREGGETLLPIIAYYGTGRLWLQPRDTAPLTQRHLSRFEGYRGSIDDRVSPRELTRWLERQDRISYQEKREPELYRTVRTAMCCMVEHATEVVFDNRRLEVVVRFDDQQMQPFGHLSDGQRNILALAGDIAMRMALLNPHLGTDVLLHTPGIILIDEIDLHLHPKWQRHIVEDLRHTFPKVQFIATTHSPFIVQTLREGELLPLEGQAISNLANKGIETIARGLMGVERPEVSPVYENMVEVAKDYLVLLDEAAGSPEEKLQKFKEQLAAKIAPFADNPAYQAFLELKYAAKLGE